MIFSRLYDFVYYETLSLDKLIVYNWFIALLICSKAYAWLNIIIYTSKDSNR